MALFLVLTYPQPTSLSVGTKRCTLFVQPNLPVERERTTASNSDFMDGLEVEDAKAAAIARIEAQGQGEGATRRSRRRG